MENLNIQICPKCGTRFIEDQHYWSGTGKPGNPIDLAGLVCNRFGDETCINPCRGREGGDTWEKRLQFVDKFTKDMDDYKNR
jgi:hypothetical protein